MANTETMFLYCVAHKLSYVDHVLLARYYGGEEEWEGVQCAGLDAEGTPYVVQDYDGNVKVVTAFADGHRRMEDAWRTVSREELESGVRLHAE